MLKMCISIYLNLVFKYCNLYFKESNSGYLQPTRTALTKAAVSIFLDPSKLLYSVLTYFSFPFLEGNIFVSLNLLAEISGEFMHAIIIIFYEHFQG